MPCNSTMRIWSSGTRSRRSFTCCHNARLLAAIKTTNKTARAPSANPVGLSYKEAASQKCLCVLARLEMAFPPVAGGRRSGWKLCSLSRTLEDLPWTHSLGRAHSRNRQRQLIDGLANSWLSSLRQTGQRGKCFATWSKSSSSRQPSAYPGSKSKMCSSSIISFFHRLSSRNYHNHQNRSNPPGSVYAGFPILDSERSSFRFALDNHILPKTSRSLSMANLTRDLTVPAARQATSAIWLCDSL